jgi:adenylate kinase family enzyme
MWDVQRGVMPVNEAGQDAMGFIQADNTVGNPLGMLDEAAKLPERTMLFVHNAAKVAEAAGLPWIQGVWNLRDQFKQDRRTLILLGRDSVVPAELEGDVVTLDEELPGKEELEAIVRSLDEAACKSVSDRPKAKESTIGRAVEAIQGLAAFPAEQAVAMSVRATGFDLDHLWEVKRSMIEDTPGLSCWRGGEKFDDIGGLENAKQYCSQLIQGRKRYGAVVFIDEIEKLMAGSTGSDTSGVSQGFLQVLLTYMQDHNVSGMIFVGHPGAGKSMLGKALGSEAGVPTIALDTNAMKSSLVGSSEQRIRSAMKVITAVSNDRPLFVATCNAIANLPPELRRRFTAGTFFFDLPTEDERQVIWDHYIKQYNLEEDSDADLPDDKDWTGAEIRSCCQGAWERKVSLVNAAQFVVPVAKADPERIERLRKEAAGRYISASEFGTYKIPEKAKAGRKLG